jgi:hypothetical protein
MSTATLTTAAVRHEPPATMTGVFYAQHKAEVSRIAARVWKHSHVFAVDDIEQAIWEHALVNWKHYADASAESASKFMTRAARKFAFEERIKHMYATGAFIYTPDMIKSYLETCAWMPLEQMPDADSRVDLQQAFQQLSESAPAQAAAVFKRYGLREKTLMTKTDSSNLSQGIVAITHRLNSGLKLTAESVEVASLGDEE